MQTQAPAETVEAIQNNVSDAAIVEAASLTDEDIHAIIPESDIGSFYRAVRETDAEAEMVRDGDRIRGFLNL